MQIGHANLTLSGAILFFAEKKHYITLLSKDSREWYGFEFEFGPYVDNNLGVDNRR